MKRQLLSIGLLLLASAPLLAQQDDVETRAMRDELQRSMKDLHLDSTDGPYYIAYKIVDSDRKAAEASFGSLVTSEENRTRTLTVTVRVGSYDLDSSNYNGGGLASLTALLSSIAGGNNVLPVDDSYDELRRKIWLATDAAYKKAVEDLSAKKAAQQNRNREETVPDFSKEPARAESEDLPPINESLADAEHIVRETSAVFRTLPLVQTSESIYEVENTTEHFLNSEGTTYTRQVPEVFFRATASLQTRSGEVFTDSYSAYGRSLADLPDETGILKNSKAVVERMTLRRAGMTAQRYSGPVLVEEEAAPQLLAHNFANQLAARGRAGAGGGAAGAIVAALLGASGGGGAAASGALLNKVGSRVFPDFLTVVDNPQLTQLEGHPLFGNYKFDEEGVPSRETVLIKDGILKTLLTSRTPARGMLQSTGNMREQGVMPGNLIVTASKSSSRDDLRKQLIDLVKARGLEYGIVIRRLSNLQALEAVRLYPDGREEPVRDSRIAEITVASFKDILAVSNERTFYTESGQGALAGLGLASAGDLVTYVVPDMLFEDMTVEHMADNAPKPPDISSPLASN
jgi:predicted Zn-dependent protease